MAFRLASLRGLAPVLPALLLAACTTPFGCPDGNWQRAGYRDAMAGHGPGFVEGYGRACAGPIGDADKAAWAQGHADGVQAYCTPRHAYLLGRTRGTFNPGLCPETDRKRLADDHHHGRMEREMLDDLRGSRYGRVLPRF